MNALVSGLLAGVATAADGAGERAVHLATRLVEEVGPRAAGTAGGEAAQGWVAVELAARGWPPEVRSGEGDGSVFACRAGERDRTVLFIAHTDAVHPEVPGANDNAAAVAVLLTVAERLRTPTPRRVCLLFPDGEEVGFLGTRRFAAEHPLPGLDQVVALDLVGRGRITHHGLGTQWDAPRLSALLSAAPADVPWMYRAVSWAMPGDERSDHAVYAAVVPSSLLLARAEGGVYLAYHSVRDTPAQLQVGTLEAAVAAVQGIAHAPPLPGRSGPSMAAVVPFTNLVLGGGFLRWYLMGAMAAGTLSLGVQQRKATVSTSLGVQPPVHSARSAWRGWPSLGLLPLAGLGCFAAMGVASVGRDFSMALCDWVIAAAWAGFWLVTALLPNRLEAEDRRRAATLAAGVPMVALVALGHPLVAVPLATTVWGTVVLALRPSLAQPVALASLWAPAYLVRPDAVRELAFHGLVDASALLWAVLGTLLLAPAWSLVRVRGRAPAVVAALILVVCWVGAWCTPVANDAWPMLEQLWPGDEGPRAGP